MIKDGCSLKTIRVRASIEYDVIIGRNLISNAGKYISKVLKKCKVAVITDDTVDALYSKKVISSLTESGYSVVKFVFCHGEESKNLQTYGEILNFLAQEKLTRTDAIVALGGGVTGDMAGFVSATYLRGIKCVQIPTTLLSQIDSSVGGKTAVDLPAGKNLVGAFFQPQLVLCDIDTLDTLPEEIYKDGMGEVAKYALLDQKIYSLLSDENYAIEDLVYLCVDYKRQIVEKDELEGGLRKLLNLGHTPAHGIERLSNYTVPHGKAVSMGLNIIVENAFRHNYIDENTRDKMLALIKKCAGELTLPYSVKDICESALYDKKRSGEDITLIMPYGIGDARAVKINVGELWGYLT